MEDKKVEYLDIRGLTLEEQVEKDRKLLPGHSPELNKIIDAIIGWKKANEGKGLKTALVVNFMSYNEDDFKADERIKGYSLKLTDGTMFGYGGFSMIDKLLENLIQALAENRKGKGEKK